MNRKILVTAALPYANGRLHLGHLRSTYLPADVYARYCRLRAYDAVFVCATDEHGTPIEIKAEKEGKKPQEFVKFFREKHAHDFKRAGIEFDEFYYTDSPENVKYAHEFFLKLKDKNLIYEKKILQTYCPKCKRVLPDRYVKGECPHCSTPDQYGDSCESCGRTYNPVDLKNPKCSICATTPTQQESNHFFFKLSACSDFCKKFLTENKKLPSDVVNYLMNWVEKGLEDWDITRDGPYFGIPIPDSQNKFFYVWFDAPIGYVSSTAHYAAKHGKTANEYWKSNAEIVHFIGKDIQYFHFLFWPAMLNFSGFNTPSRIPTRGYLNIEGNKMSKSRGTFITLEEALAKYPADYYRYYLTAITPNNTSDGNFSWPEFEAKVNGELIDSYGNFVYRVLYFAFTKIGDKIPEPGGYAPEDKEFNDKLNNFADEVAGAFEEIELKTALEKIMAFAGVCNKYFNDRAPWHLLKTKPADAHTVVYSCLKAVYAISLALYPITPKSCETVFAQLGLGKTVKKWGDYTPIKPGTRLPSPKIMFEKIKEEKEENQ